MSTWTREQYEGFRDELADIYYEGWRVGVADTSWRFSALCAFDSEPVKRRIARICDHWVDRTYPDWASYFNSKTGLIVQNDPAVVPEWAERELQSFTEEHCRRRNPEFWKRGITRAPELTSEEQERRHQLTTQAVERMQRRIDTLFAQYEAEILAEEARLVQERKAMLAEIEQRRRNRPAPAPEPQVYGVSPRGAEFLARDWLRHLGLLSAVVTRANGDDGIDIVADHHVAQVKHYTGSVGVIPLRELFGVAAAKGKQAVFLTSSRYTAEASVFADAVEMPLLVYSAEEGTLQGANAVGVNAVTHGFTE